MPMAGGALEAESPPHSAASTAASNSQQKAPLRTISTPSSSAEGSTASTAVPGSSIGSSGQSSALTLRDQKKRAQVKSFLISNGFTTVQSHRRRFRVTSYPLHVAVKKFDVEMVELLLHFGADPQKTNSRGETPGELAIRKSSQANLDAVEEILGLLQEAVDAAAPEEGDEEGSEYGHD